MSAGLGSALGRRPVTASSALLARRLRTALRSSSTTRLRSRLALLSATIATTRLVAIHATCMRATLGQTRVIWSSVGVMAAQSAQSGASRLSLTWDQLPCARVNLALARKALLGLPQQGDLGYWLREKTRHVRGIDVNSEQGRLATKVAAAHKRKALWDRYRGALRLIVHRVTLRVA